MPNRLSRATIEVLWSLGDLEPVELTNHRVVAIDGGTATGKGRLIQELSQLLRLHGIPVVHLSTGFLYRAVALVALEQISPRMGVGQMVSHEQVQEALKRLSAIKPEQLLSITKARQVEMHGGVIWLDGEAIDEARLKGPGTGVGSSIVSMPRMVREFVNAVARRQVNEFDGFVVMDGRDTTHVIVPDAPLKLLLTVSPEVAATRSTEHTMAEIVARDERDRSKGFGALRTAANPGENVIVIHTDAHTPESIRDNVYSLMRKTFTGLPRL